MPGISVSSRPSPSQVRHSQNTTYQHHGIPAGCTLWLPNKHKIDAHLLEGVDIDDGCFNHPIVVLSTDLVEGKATVLVVSILIPRFPSYVLSSQLTLEAYFL